MFKNLEELWRECRTLRPIERSLLLRRPGRQPGELARGDVLIALLADTMKFYTPDGDRNFMPILSTVLHFATPLAEYENRALTELVKVGEGLQIVKGDEVDPVFLVVYDEKVATLNGQIDGMALETGEVSSFHSPSHFLQSRSLNLKKLLAVRCGFEKV